MIAGSCKYQVTYSNVSQASPTFFCAGIIMSLALPGPIIFLYYNEQLVFMYYYLPAFVTSQLYHFNERYLPLFLTRKR